MVQNCFCRGGMWNWLQWNSIFLAQGALGDEVLNYTDGYIMTRIPLTQRKICPLCTVVKRSMAVDRLEHNVKRRVFSRTDSCKDGYDGR